jgi:hypothetical protein
MRPPGARTSDEWRRLAEDSLGAWWTQWEAPLSRHDNLRATAAAGDNFAFLAKDMGLGRSKWLAEAFVGADMWDRRVLVLCPPMLRLYWHRTLCDAGFSAERVTALSAWAASRGAIRAQAALLRQLDEADIVIIEPPCRPRTKLFAALAKQAREAGRSTQIITTTTMVWGANLAPPRYVDSCLKLLGYLDAHEDIKVCWTEDCFAPETVVVHRHGEVIGTAVLGESGWQAFVNAGPTHIGTFDSATVAKYMIEAAV